MKMKRQYILYFSILCALCVGQPAYAQDDESLDEEETVSVPKKKQAKIPSYPTVEVKGVCVHSYPITLYISGLHGTYGAGVQKEMTGVCSSSQE